MGIRRFAVAAALALFTFAGVVPAIRAATYTQPLPAGCTTPTLSDTTLSCNGAALFTIVDYPCASQLVLGEQNGNFVITCATPNFSGLYWSPAESGQGYTLTHQGNSIFVLAFVYGTDRTPLWLSMLAQLDDTGVYVGDVFVSTGQPGSSTPHTYAAGSLTPNGDGTVALQLGGVTKTLQRYDFDDGAPSPTCQFGTAPAATTGLWWNQDQSGAGFGVHHQGGRVFVTWYTYDAAGNARWYSTLLNTAGANTYSGQVYSTTGPTFGSTLYDPATVLATATGSATLVITDSDHATFTLDATSIPLTRFTFVMPGTGCQ
jgi:hypothetical protein